MTKLFITLGLALLFVILSGCTMYVDGHQYFGQGMTSFAGILAGMAVMVLLFVGWTDGWKFFVLAVMFGAMFFMGGCATLPMPLQPKNGQYNSDMAEGAFIVLAGVDTLQTMHEHPGTKCGYEANPIAAALYGSREPRPSRVLLTNLVMITVHTMVASWLDDKVAAEDAKAIAGHDNNLGPWYVGRVVFHAVSLVAESAAVANNFSKGCKL